MVPLELPPGVMSMSDRKMVQLPDGGQRRSPIVAFFLPFDVPRTLSLRRPKQEISGGSRVSSFQRKRTDMWMF